MRRNSKRQEVWDSLHKLIEGIANLKDQMADNDLKTNQNLDKLRQNMADNDLKTNQNLDKLRQNIADNDLKTNQKFDRLNEIVGGIGNNLDRLNEIVGGMGNNQGEIAEDLFFNSFAKTKTLGKIKFHSIDRNVRRLYNNIQDEFDIVLTNDELIMIVEVKVKCHPNDVKKVLKKISNYKRLFPQYYKYKIYGAIAGLTFPQKTIEMAKTYQIYVLTQEGNELKLLNDPQKVNS